MNIREGDSVRLTSGGPIITVVSINHSCGWVTCPWYEDSTKIIPLRQLLGFALASVLISAEVASA